MNPITFDQVISLASCITAVVALLVGFWRGSKTHATEQKGLAAEVARRSHRRHENIARIS